MESNMTTLKRRLNQAIGECRSHASVTARRLVRSTILTTAASDLGTGDEHAEPNMWRPVSSGGDNHSSKTVVRHSTISGRPFARHNRPTFSYSFEPLGTAQGEENDKQQFSSGGGHYNELTGYQHLGDDAAAATAKWSRLTASQEEQSYATSTARQAHLLTRSEFSPQSQIAPNAPTCHQYNDRLIKQHHQEDNMQHRVTTSVVDHNCCEQQTQTIRPHISPTTSGCLPQVHLITHNHHLQTPMSQSGEHQQQVANTSGSSMQRQYFMRSSLNESIKARRSHRRSHRRSSGADRRLGPQLAGMRRQVRFQPIPQAINISAYSSGSSNGSGGSGGVDDEDPDLQTSNSSQLSSSSISGLETSIGSTAGGWTPTADQQRAQATTTTTAQATTAFIKNRSHHINIKRMQQQLSRLGRKSRLRVTGASVRPRFSSKPFTQQLGNIKPSFASFGGKIKSFASHIQQSLGASGSSSHSVTASGQQIPVPPPTPKLPLQKTFHLRSSAATAKHQIHLSSSLRNLDTAGTQTRQSTYNFLTGNQHFQQPAAAADLDDGWGSDFDDTPSNVGDLQQQQQQHSMVGETTANNDTTTCSSASATTMATGCYLLEIGKSSCDTRAVGDVIQDQGICGQFKRLHDVSLLDIPYQPPVKSSQDQKLEQVRQELERVDLDETDDKRGPHREPEVVTPGAETPSELQAAGGAEDEDDEAELRSLEARQGFRQVRDKLKLILDQRLACFERDLTGNTPISKQSHQLVKSDAEVEASGEAPAQVSSDRERATTSELSIGVVEVQVDHQFDCRSNCSEASSLSSGGLDSNHSGSQDSGHSTQHSGYSAIRHLHHERHHQATAASASNGSKDSSNNRQPAGSGTSTETSPTNQLDSGASTCGDPEPSPPLPTCQSARPSPPRQLVLSSTPKSQQQQQQVPSKQQAVASSPECEERRNRFIQNRLIINNKLESMFRSRSGGLNSSPASGGPTTTRNSLNSCESKEEASFVGSIPDNNFNSPTKSIQSCPTPTPIDHHHHPTTVRHLALSSCQSEPSVKGTTTALDPVTRLKLLEQQRQMSLKLKQKPRRRTAKRALNLADCGASLASCSGSSTGCNASLDNQSITTITNETEPTDEPSPPAAFVPHQNYQRSSVSSQPKSQRFSRNGSTRRRWNQESLTKQLSMVCLRQLERNDERATDNMRGPKQRQREQQQVAASQATCAPLSQVPRPAMSLRQLVKEEIDDCARPGRLSTLTRNILNRSDSLSSGDGSGEQLC